MAVESKNLGKPKQDSRYTYRDSTWKTRIQVNNNITNLNLMFIGPRIIVIAEEYRLDVTCYFIFLLTDSTCFGH
jgi:hypothetical protein